MSSIVGRLIRMISPRGPQGPQVEWTSTPTSEKDEPQGRRHDAAFASEDNEDYDNENEVAKRLLSPPTLDHHYGDSSVNVEEGGSILERKPHENLAVEEGDAESISCGPEADEALFCTAPESIGQVYDSESFAARGEQRNNDSRRALSYRERQEGCDTEFSQKETRSQGRQNTLEEFTDGDLEEVNQHTELNERNSNVQIVEGESRSPREHDNIRLSVAQDCSRADVQDMAHSESKTLSQTRPTQSDVLGDSNPRRNEEITHSPSTPALDVRGGFQMDCEAADVGNVISEQPPEQSSSKQDNIPQPYDENTTCRRSPFSAEKAESLDRQRAEEEIERKDTAGEDAENNSLRADGKDDCLESNDGSISAWMNPQQMHKQLASPLAMSIDMHRGKEPDADEGQDDVVESADSQPLSQDAQGLGSYSTPVTKNSLLTREEHGDDEGGVDEESGSSDEKIMTQQESEETSHMREVEALKTNTLEQKEHGEDEDRADETSGSSDERIMTQQESEETSGVRKVDALKTNTSEQKEREHDECGVDEASDSSDEKILTQQELEETSDARNAEAISTGQREIDGCVDEGSGSSEENIMTQQGSEETSDMRKLEGEHKELSSSSSENGANTENREDAGTGGDEANREREGCQDDVDGEATTNSPLPASTPVVVDTVGMFFQQKKEKRSEKDEKHNAAHDTWRQTASSSALKFLQRRLAAKNHGEDENDTLDGDDMEVECCDVENVGIETEMTVYTHVTEDLNEAQEPHTQEDCLSFKTAKQSLDVDSTFRGSQSQEEEELEETAERLRCKEGRVAGSKRKMIHVNDTSGHCRSVDELDLRCGSFTLDLCQVLSVCDIRGTRRILHWPSYRESVPESRGNKNEHNRDTRDQPVRLRMPRGGVWEDDGPLQGAYKSVIGVEFLELCGGMTGDEAARVRTVAAAAFNQRTKKPPSAQRRRRIRAYFYNQYAIRMSELLEPWSLASGKRPEKPSPFFSLRNIPARCIMLRPFSSEDSSVDFDGALLGKQYGRLSSYCLCIGDRFRPPSRVPRSCPVQDFSAPPWNDLRFDSLDMEIRALEFDTPKVTAKALETAEEIYLNARVLKHGWTTESGSNVIASSYAAVFPVATDGADENRTESEVGQRCSSESKNKMQDTSKGGEVLPVEESEDMRRSKRARRSTRRNTYIQLGDLKRFFKNLAETKRRMMRGEIVVRRVEDKVNVFGVVLGFTPASPTRGPDLVMKVYLIDENVHEANGDGGAQPSSSSVSFISLHIFSQDRGAMPQVVKAGDVVRAHRVTVQEWKGETQLLANASSSFLVMRPKDENYSVECDIEPLTQKDEWTLIATAKDTFSFDREHLERAAELWLWGQKRLADYPTMKGDQKMTVSQLSQEDFPVWSSGHDRHRLPAENLHGDMTVLLTGFTTIPTEERTGATPVGVLRVWDGTGPPISDRPLVAGASATGCDPPTEAVEAVARITSEMKKKSTDEDEFQQVFAPKSLCGRVINVAVWETAHWEKFVKENEANVGQFVRLRNVADGLLNGLSCIMVHSKSSLIPLPDHTYEVKVLLLQHHDRIVRNDPFNARSAVLPLDTPTELVGDDAAMVGIKYLMPPKGERSGSLCLEEALGEPAPFEFDARFRISQTYPPIAPKGLNSDCRVLCCQDAQEREEQMKMRFCFALQIYDDSADMDVVVPSHVGEALLKMTAVSLCADEEKNQECCRRLHKLLGPDTVCHGRIHSMAMEGFKYFIIDAVDVVHLNN